MDKDEVAFLAELAKTKIVLTDQMVALLKRRLNTYLGDLIFISNEKSGLDPQSKEIIRKAGNSLADKLDELAEFVKPMF